MASVTSLIRSSFPSADRAPSVTSIRASGTWFFSFSLSHFSPRHLERRRVALVPRIRGGPPFALAAGDTFQAALECPKAYMQHRMPSSLEFVSHLAVESFLDAQPWWLL